VSKPFAMLGSLFGGGEELAFVEFAPGSAALADETKLKTLAKALDSRPGLKLEVSGGTDAGADRDALKRAALDRQVRAAKLKDSEAALEAGEYEKYLAVAFHASGLPKDTPAAEMEQLMLSNVQVGDDELRQLADARAQAAKDWLVESGKIAPQRIFIAAAKAGAEGSKDQGKASRVDFSLR
jgi:hypothetical protein